MPKSEAAATSAGVPQKGEEEVGRAVDTDVAAQDVGGVFANMAGSNSGGGDDGSVQLPTDDAAQFAEHFAALQREHMI